MENKTPLVTHFVAGYPDYAASLAVARGLIAGGAFALEMQIPFSDPSADGPVIENACLDALRGGFTVADAWRLMADIRRESDIPVFVMSYAGPVLARGVEVFASQASGAGSAGLIVPDLVPGADDGLFVAAAAAGCPAVPVVVPWVSRERLEKILSVNPEWVYVALRSGITGSYTDLGEAQKTFLAMLRERREGGRASAAITPRVMAGFGIQSPGQVEGLSPLVDAVVVGSAIVRAIDAAGRDGEEQAVKDLVRTLGGDSNL